jgi:hypothetical protein
MNYSFLSEEVLKAVFHIQKDEALQLMKNADREACKVHQHRRCIRNHLRADVKTRKQQATVLNVSSHSNML